jgi:ArsR family transcriptional regulator, virulence genes transcriptional regulator
MQTATLQRQEHKEKFLAAKKAAGVLRALNHPLRQQIIDYLTKQPERPVTMIYVHFRLEQSVCSQHLAILRKEGLLTAKRDGKQIFYSVNQKRLKQVIELSEKMAEKN